jgi:hypothetical protein
MKENQTKIELQSVAVYYVGGASCDATRTLMDETLTQSWLCSKSTLFVPRIISQMNQTS